MNEQVQSGEWCKEGCEQSGLAVGERSVRASARACQEHAEPCEVDSIGMPMVPRLKYEAALHRQVLRMPGWREARTNRRRVDERLGRNGLASASEKTGVRPWAKKGRSRAVWPCYAGRSLSVVRRAAR
eukprot:6178585-Pleurochrysis_carterae.AAC.3